MNKIVVNKTEKPLVFKVKMSDIEEGAKGLFVKKLQPGKNVLDKMDFKKICQLQYFKNLKKAELIDVIIPEVKEEIKESSKEDKKKKDK